MLWYYDVYSPSGLAGYAWADGPDEAIAEVMADTGVPLLQPFDGWRAVPQFSEAEMLERGWTNVGTPRG